MAKQNPKNSLQNEQSTKPLVNRIPPVPPVFKNFPKPNFMKNNKSGPSFLQSFRTQSRGGK